MTAPGGSPSTPPEDESRAKIVGAVLIGVAVIIGFVLLLKGFDQEGGVVQTAGPKPEKTTTTTAPADEETTTTTTPAAKPVAEVSVMVANGSGAAGVAGTNAQKLKTAGYTTVDTANAPVQATSAVYFAAGAQADAEGVAKVLGIDAAKVAPLPEPPPTDPKGATVVVVIGSDLA